MFPDAKLAKNLFLPAANVVLSHHTNVNELAPEDPRKEKLHDIRKQL